MTGFTDGYRKRVGMLHMLLALALVALAPVPQGYDVGPLSFGESVDELRETLGAGKTIGNQSLQTCYPGPYHIDRFTDGKSVVYADVQDGIVSMFTIDLMPRSIPNQPRIPQRAGRIADWKWQGNRLSATPFPIYQIYRAHRSTIARPQEHATEEVFNFAGQHDPVVSVLVTKREKKIAKLLECYPD